MMWQAILPVIGLLLWATAFQKLVVEPARVSCCTVESSSAEASSAESLGVSAELPTQQPDPDEGGVGEDHFFTSNSDVIQMLGDNNSLVYFPFNSDEKISNPELLEFLDSLSVRLLKSQRAVRVIGYTDSVGEDEVNILMGQRRADAIRAELIARGVPESRITSESKGAANPIATNRTLEGRRKNRRVEINIINP